MSLYLSVLLLGMWGCSEKESESSDWDAYVFSVDCNALQDLFVTSATSSINDWTGYWECYQENNDCNSEDCSWNPEELPSYLIEDSCADAQSCTINGVEIPPSCV